MGPSFRGVVYRWYQTQFGPLLQLAERDGAEGDAKHFVQGIDRLFFKSKGHMTEHQLETAAATLIETNLSILGDGLFGSACIFHGCTPKGVFREGNVVSVWSLEHEQFDSGFDARFESPPSKSWLLGRAPQN